MRGTRSVRALLVLLAGCACEGSMPCTNTTPDPPACTMTFRGECPGQDLFSCCGGTLSCLRDSCPTAPSMCPPAVDAGPIDAPRTDAPGTDAPGSSGCALPQPFDVGVTYTRTIHVAVGGTGDGSSEASAMGDVEAALRMATPGTEVLLHPGIYAGDLYVENVVGTEAAPIALRGEPGAILEGGGETLHVSTSSYFVIEGIEARGSTANGINVDDGGTGTGGDHLVFRGLHIHDIGGGGNNDCLKLSGLDDFWVLGVEISGCDAGDAIDMVGCHDGIVAGSSFHDSPGSGGIQMKGGSADILVHGNVFADVEGRSINAGGSTGLEFFRPIDAPYEAARLRIVANVFVRSGDTPIAFVGCDACIFAHDTVIDPVTRVSRILQESTDARFVPSRDGLFVNDLVVYEASVVSFADRFVNIGTGTAPETFTYGSNLWYARDDPSSPPMIPSPIPPETGSISGMDPMLSATFGIAASSPAVGLGRDVPEIAGLPDAAGRCRPSPPSAGAFEP